MDLRTAVPNAASSRAPGTLGAPSAAALELIDRLIAFPTVSRDSNLGLIEFARDHLLKLGVKPRLAYDAGRRKASLFCSLADVSRAKQVQVAVDRLQSTGANIAGAVLSGVQFNRYVYRYGAYTHA